MNTADLIFLAVVVVAWPLYVALVRYPRLTRDTAAGKPGARPFAYLEGVLTQWGLCAVAIPLWLRGVQTNPDYPRTLQGLGLAMPGGTGFWIGLALAAAVSALAVTQTVAILRSPENRRKALEQLGKVAPLLPRTPGERNGFMVVSFTAGACEEILFRGYLMGGLAVFLGDWGAMGVSAVIFGLAHAYQGTRGILQTGAVGVVMGILYLVTGTLWVPMALHALIDVNSGLLGYRLLRSGEPATA